MLQKEIQKLYDNGDYVLLLDKVDINNVTPWDSEIILLYLKSILALDDFMITDVSKIKKLCFMYFLEIWKVNFTNNYSFIIKKEEIDFRFNGDIDKKSNLWSYQDYFDLWSNEVFLNWHNIKEIFETYADMINFFIFFIWECSELYSFSWPDFPFFKWLFNELTDE